MLIEPLLQKRRQLLFFPYDSGERGSRSWRVYDVHVMSSHWKCAIAEHFPRRRRELRGDLSMRFGQPPIGIMLLPGSGIGQVEGFHVRLEHPADRVEQLSNLLRKCRIVRQPFAARRLIVHFVAPRRLGSRADR